MNAAMNLGYQVELEQFEGPLALLLFLIRKEELDIYDIPIHKITRQYLEYIRKMKELDLEVAGEFVAMAATLIHIKSRMLLPTYDENGEVVEEADPRKELVQKLLEYQKFQEAAHKLYERPLLGRDYWLRGVREEIIPEKEGEIIITEENALFALISSYRSVIRNQKQKVHKVGEKEQSIAHRLSEIKELLIPGVRTSLFEILGKKPGVETDSVGHLDSKLLITFLSLLELGKMGFVSLFQSEPFADIYIDARKEIDSDAISNVEEYNAAKADEVADQLTAGDVTELIDEAQAEQDLVQENEVGQLGLGMVVTEKSEDQAEQVESESLELSADSTIFDSVMADDDAENDEISGEEIATDEDILLEEQRMAQEASEPSGDMEL